MQSLEIISINLWQILISLCNLLILFLILKKFLYNPVKKVLADRQAALDSQYEAVDDAKSDALKMKRLWQDKISTAETEANNIISNAVKNAEKQSDTILNETREQAGQILRQAEIDAELRYKKSEAEIKKEIVCMSTALSEKMLGREINTDDHRNLINSFISEIGENNDGDE